jgi:hypothetical protein
MVFVVSSGWTGLYVLFSLGRRASRSLQDGVARK